MGPTDRVSDKPSEICYLLAAAGSGKTHRMFKMLEEKFGFYIVSGRVGDQENRQDVGDYLYQPRASIASGDAKLLTRILERGRTSPYCEYLGRGLSQIRFEDRCDMLLQSRLLLFSVIFKTLREREFSLQPRHWLQYQLSCNGDADPLSRMLRCVYLSSQSPDLPREISLLMTSPFSLLAIERVPEDIPFLWCFDEVQCDLDEVTSRSATSRNLGESRKISTLSTMINSVILMDGLNSSVLAGTALNLQGVKEAVTAGMDAGTSIRYTTGGSTRPRTRALDRCHLISDKNLDGLLEPTIRSLLEVIWDATMLGASLVGNETILQDPYFLKRFRQRRLEGLFGLQEQKAVGKILDYLQSNEIWAEIKNHSVALWGRYRWSVCYIEELFRNLVVHGSLTKNLVSKASEDVQKAAKEPLKRRIQELAKSADPKRQQLATDVFHMAIQFKLYGRSRFLDTAAAAILIEQALGYVQEVTEGKVKVCLAERLVVDAVMEHLRETNPPGNITDQHLGTWQYSPSSFGFITEDRLGEAVYSAAHESQDEATRRLFLSNFDSVYKITPTSIGGSISLSLGDFVLEEKPGPAAVGLDEKGDVGQWLEQVVLGNPRQSFLLPTKYAGPDLMFVLCNKSTNPVQRLVCAVQSKVVNNFHIEDKVLNTLDPDQWYRGSTALYERGKFLEKFNQVKNTTKSEIAYLSILLLVCNENVDIYKIITSLITRKKVEKFAQDIVSKAESRNEEAESKWELEQTPKNQQACDDTLIDVKEANDLMNRIKRTDYFAKVITSNSVEPIFGQIYNRIAQGIKDNAVDDGDEEDEGKTYIGPRSLTLSLIPTARHPRKRRCSAVTD